MNKDTVLCNSLEEVRQNIDQIDDKLIHLIAERSYYINQAADIKNSANEVTSQDRIDKVIRRARELAKRKQLDPAIAEKVFRTMIRAFLQQEMERLSPAYKEIKNSYY